MHQLGKCLQAGPHEHVDSKGGLCLSGHDQNILMSDDLKPCCAPLSLFRDCSQQYFAVPFLKFGGFPYKRTQWGVVPLPAVWLSSAGHEGRGGRFPCAAADDEEEVAERDRDEGHVEDLTIASAE